VTANGASEQLGLARRGCVGLSQAAHRNEGDFGCQMSSCVGVDLAAQCRMKFARLEILATVLVAAGSMGAASSCSSKPCAPIPCPAPGFDQDTCECSKPQTAGAGTSGGGTSGNGTNAGAGGMSGDAEAGAICPAPIANTCPDKLTVYTAQRVDLVANCFLPEEAVSCQGPLVAEASACWVKLDTGDIYVQAVWPCMPDGWRSCTQQEKDSVSNVVGNCK